MINAKTLCRPFNHFAKSFQRTIRSVFHNFWIHGQSKHATVVNDRADLLGRLITAIKLNIEADEFGWIAMRDSNRPFRMLNGVEPGLLIAMRNVYQHTDGIHLLNYATAKKT